jgi:sec-independent protein translocase protein TatA
MWGLSIGHWAIVVLVIILLFGRNMISNLMTDIGKGIRNARVAVRELEHEP